MNFFPFGAGRPVPSGLNFAFPLLVLSLALAASSAASAGDPHRRPRNTASRQTASAAAESAPVIISPATTQAVVTQSFNYQIILADFATGTFTADGLAPGLTLDAGTGVISGVPTTPGTFVVRLTATNSGGTGTSTLTVTVEPAAPPEITSATVLTALRGVVLNYQIAATNSPTSYGADILPAGLSLDTATGVISGAPVTVGTYPLTLSAANVRGAGTAVLILNVVAEVPTITLVADTPTANPLHGEVGSFTLTRIGTDFSQPLTVVFTIKGTAQNGVDYQSLSLSKTIKAGKAVKRIHVTPFNPDNSAPDTKKTVKLTVQASDAYTLGDSIVAKVKILYDP